MNVRRAIIALALLTVLAGCQSMRPTSGQNYFIVFFVPGTTRLTPEALDIVRQASDTAQGMRASKVEVAVPVDAPGGAQLREGRFTAIQNIFSASGLNPSAFARTQVSAEAASLPGAGDRAEIRLIP